MCLLYGGRPLQTPCTASTVFRQGRGVSQGVLQRPLLRGPERVQVISSQAHSSLIQLQSDLSDLSLRAGRLDIPPAWPYELAVFGLAACAIVLWQCRPRGWSDSGLVAVKDSSIHGKGLFAVCLIPEGSVIGEYPGLLRNSAQVMEKVQLAPRAKGYLFRLTEYAGFDPTDAYGNVSSRPGPGFVWPLPIDPALAYANEPPTTSGGPNVTAEDAPAGDSLHFRASRDITAGEEIYIDYGPSYDRSQYQ